jgi:Ca2+-binding RTX toxin-like protein
MKRAIMVALMATALSPASAQALSVERYGSGPYGGTAYVMIFADPGEANNILVTRNGNDIVVTDTGASTVTSNDCAVVGKTATCTFPADDAAEYIYAQLGDGNDRIQSDVSTTAKDFGMAFSANGGPGDDELIGSDATKGSENCPDCQQTFDFLRGGTGNDTLRGRAGRDHLTDTDDDMEEQGSEGGNDKFYGGSGNDYLSAFSGDDELRGEDGDDILEPGTGNDPVVDGGVNFDEVRYYIAQTYNPQTQKYEPEITPTTPGATIKLPDPGATTTGNGFSGENDALTSVEDADGSQGADAIVGSNTSNVINGNGGNDGIVGGAGPDSLSGGGDDDSVDAADGETDRIFCGGNAGDKIKIDQKDLVAGDCPAPGSANATQVTVTPPGTVVNTADTSPPDLQNVKAPSKIKEKTLEKKGYTFSGVIKDDKDTVRVIGSLEAKVRGRVKFSAVGELLLGQKRVSAKGKFKATIKIPKSLRKSIRKGTKMRLLITATDPSGNNSARRKTVKVN